MKLCEHCLDYLRTQGYKVWDLGVVLDYDEAEEQDIVCEWCDEVDELHETEF